MFRECLMIALLLVLPTLVVADGPKVDLAKIDRTIKKEPVYKSQPRYALLIVGPSASHRSWFVVDGVETAYIDRNGNGDLTEPGERIELDREATDKINLSSSTRLSGMNVFPIGEVAGARLKFRLWVPNPDYDVDQDEKARTHPEIRTYVQDMRDRQWLNGTLTRVASDGSRCQTPLVLTTKREDAQICHLLGPLTFQLKWDERQRLEPWPKRTNFDIHLGTRNLPPRDWSHSGFDFSPLAISEVPSTMHPVATFEYPGTGDNGQPLREEVILDQRCCGDTLHAMMTIPKEVSSGVARVTVTFPPWVGHNVEPATFEVPINQRLSRGSEAAFVMFHDPNLELKQAVNALRKRGIDVTIRDDGLWIIKDSQVSLAISLHRGEEAREIARGLAQGTPFAEELGHCGARFEIALTNSEDALSDSQTLNTIISALQEMTQGFVYQTWDEQLSGMK